jgi:hypothetical protein
MATQPDPAPEPTVEPPAASPLADVSADATEPGDSLSLDGKPERGTAAEAKKYRLKLREAEAERDKFRALVEQHTRADVERAVAEMPSTLADSADLWQAGVKLEDLLDDEHGIDAAKLDAAVAHVIAEHPTWAKTKRVVDLGQGPRGEPVGRTSIDSAVRDAVQRR